MTRANHGFGCPDRHVMANHAARLTGSGNHEPNAIHPRMKYSKNPIINRFLQLTIEEGKSVRCLELGHCPNSAKTVRFRLGDGTDCQFVDNQDSRTFMKSWQDASDFVKRLRHVDLSPAL